MDLSKVKLVVSDMDGTLLNEKGEVSNRFFELFKKLQQKNIHFVAASGRQYNSIINKLETIKDDIYIVAENGGIVKRNEEVLLINTIKPKNLLQLIPILRNIENTYIVLCGKDSAYIETKNEHFIDLFQEYYAAYKIVDDLTEVVNETDFLKIAIYHYGSSEEFIYPKVKTLEREYLIKISGPNWLDISDRNTNKGNGIKLIQKLLNITKEETMVFGDFHNDIEMMNEAHFSFAMQNAHKDIKKIARFSTDDNNNFGVEKILEQLLDAQK
jgi:Cof subfamily protein (haloacid dehalogenase superfamily)